MEEILNEKKDAQDLEIRLSTNEEQNLNKEKQGLNEKKKKKKKLGTDTTSDAAKAVIKRVKKTGNLTLDGKANLIYYEESSLDTVDITKIRIDNEIDYFNKEYEEKWDNTFIQLIFIEIAKQIFNYKMVTFNVVKNNILSKSKPKKFNVLSEQIVDMANEIMLNGDPVKTILDTHATMHVGDDILAKTLLVSVGTQSVRNSAGIQPKVSGDSGKGKTHCCKAMIHLVPDKYKLATTLSDRAIYYVDIEPGTVIFSDDVVLSETLEGIIKRSTSNFQEGDKYTTLNTDREQSELTIPPRVVWWLTSVDDDASMQLLNRQFGGSVDESVEQDKKVFEFQKRLAKTGEMDFPENQEVDVCRAIFQNIKEHLYTVIIPFIDDINWEDYKNRRNFPMFQDIISAFTILRHMQRKKSEDKNIVYSDIDDYNDAMNLYNSRAKYQSTKLTDAELDFLEELKDGEEYTYLEMQIALDISKGRVTQLLYGKDGHSGLLNKVSGLSCEKNSERPYNKLISLINFDQLDFGRLIKKIKQKH